MNPDPSFPTPRASSPRVVTSVADLQAAVASARQSGRTIGLIPTMGALHRGHLSLVEAAQRAGDFTVVTIFVNPTQFGPGEDFNRYPRTLDTDLEQLASLRVDLVFAPEVPTLYLPEHATFVEPQGVALRWEGASRPGHFRGVATIVLKLLLLVAADRAYFGRKDFQQAQVIRQTVRDLNVPIAVEVCPIVREADGLALSSRNVYLSPDHRQQALALSASLRRAAELVAGGEQSVPRILAVMRGILEAGPDVRIDYIAVVHPDSLEPLEQVTAPAVALIAARVGTTRLIDNEFLLPGDSRSTSSSVR